MEASNFIGNQLCGPPLTKDYRTGHKAIPSTEQVGEHEEKYGFHLSIAVGFTFGFLGTSPLLLYRTKRHAYFWFVEQMWYKILDCFGSFKHMVHT